jgi:hypothetical protein
MILIRNAYSQTYLYLLIVGSEREREKELLLLQLITPSDAHAQSAELLSMMDRPVIQTST